MAVTEVSICNMALSRVGHTTITALSDANDAARQCNLHYEPSRDALLRSHPWNFAVKRTRLITQAETAKTITGATKANPCVITAASHGYSDGDRVKIETVGGMTEINDRYFTINVLTTSTFELVGENSTSYTTYTSGGTATKVPASTFDYWFTLPTDCLRVIRVDDDLYTWKNENGRILYNDDEADLIYIAKITDPTVFDAQFVDLLAQKIAAEIAVKLTDNANLAANLWQVFGNKQREARSFDGLDGGTPDGIEADAWINSRL